MMTKSISAALFAGAAMSAVLAAAPASATIHFAFTPGTPSPSAGYTVIDDFNTGTPGNLTGTFQIKTPPADGYGAPPANSVPTGTPYLSVLGGDVANIGLGGVSTFEFDWGSIDTYNTLVIHSSAGDMTVIPGGNFPNLANGNQALPGTNGLFIVTGDAGESFTGITLSSSTNSFEIDNVAVSGGVPEPAAWSLMIVGFGMAGGLVRARRRTAVAA